MMHSSHTARALQMLTLCCCVCLLPSCKLVSSIVKIPASIVKSVGRTVGVTNLTDHQYQAPESKTDGVQVERSIEAEAAKRKAEALNQAAE